MAKILLVENDPLEGLERKSVLERHFAEVKRVSDAAEALCCLEHPKGEGYALVVCGQPQMGVDRDDFLAEVEARWPELPVLALAQASSPAPGTKTAEWVEAALRLARQD